MAILVGVTPHPLPPKSDAGFRSHFLECIQFAELKKNNKMYAYSQNLKRVFCIQAKINRLFRGGGWRCLYRHLTGQVRELCGSLYSCLVSWNWLYQFLFIAFYYILGTTSFRCSWFAAEMLNLIPDWLMQSRSFHSTYVSLTERKIFSCFDIVDEWKWCVSEETVVIFNILWQLFFHVNHWSTWMSCQ